MAGVYATNALPLKADLIAHELPADFLEDLAADKAAFQSAFAERGNAVGDHVAARRELDDALARGVEIVRKLTSLMKVARRSIGFRSTSMDMMVRPSTLSSTLS